MPNTEVMKVSVGSPTSNGEQERTVQAEYTFKLGPMAPSMTRDEVATAMRAKEGPNQK